MHQERVADVGGAIVVNKLIHKLKSPHFLRYTDVYRGQKDTLSAYLTTCQPPVDCKRPGSRQITLTFQNDLAKFAAAGGENRLGSSERR